MVAEILCVGTELLLGNICNTNAQYLAKKLAHLGINVYYQTVVGDNRQRLRSALEIAFTRADLVVMCGGLGPTKDDLTKEVAAEYFGKTLVKDQKAYHWIEEKIGQLHIAMTDSIAKQAYLPTGCIPLYNDVGTAPGCIIERNRKTIVLLPGPPSEMQPMFELCCNQYLNSRSNRVFVSVNLKLKSMQEAPPEIVGEAPVADAISALLDLTNPTVATYAKDDGTLIRITASADNREQGMRLIIPIEQELTRRYSGYIKQRYEE